MIQEGGKWPMTKTPSDWMTFMRFCARHLFRKFSGLYGVNKRIGFFSELNRLLGRLEWV